MNPTMPATIREIVRNDHRAASVFEKYSIDFCCGGAKTLGEVCAQKGIDPEVIHRELRQVETAAGPENFRPGEWDLDTLADFIVQNHHRYVRRTLPTILSHLDKLVSVHGKNHPELAPIAGRFHAVGDELTQHMQKEELVLFPYIASLAVASRDGDTPARPVFSTVRRPIQMMEADHASAGEDLAFIRTRSDGFSLPSDACETYRVTYRELQEFERDLHRHIHLENNILFPKAIELEDTIFSSQVTG